MQGFNICFLYTNANTQEVKSFDKMIMAKDEAEALAIYMQCVKEESQEIYKHPDEWIPQLLVFKKLCK